MSSKFNNIADIFLDFINADEYVKLDRTLIFYDKLKSSIQKPLKMILLYGRPGTGKSMLLTKLYHDLKNSYNIYLYSTPITIEKEFYKQLYKDLFKNQLKNQEIDLYSLQEKLQEHQFDSTPIIFLDETQLYPQSLMESIRLLADSRLIKFVITLHKTEKEDLVAKEHFTTRIWESIELGNLNINDQKVYIQKKLLQHSFLEVANMFDDKAIETIFSFAQGNFRNTNKLLYTIFNIYHWYEINREGIYKECIKKSSISKEIIEMAAIETGLVDD